MNPFTINKNKDSAIHSPIAANFNNHEFQFNGDAELSQNKILINPQANPDNQMNSFGRNRERPRSI